MAHHLEKLLIVPGHASFKESVHLPLPADFSSDTYWALQSFQVGEPPFYIEHIQAALRAADDDTLVVFSGGRTRIESGPHWSEAATYNEIAKLYPEYLLAHIALEEYARDSFQNLEFSLRTFEKFQSRQPRHVTVVGWEFKHERFALHAAELDIPAESFTYFGVNNPGTNDLDGALRGEAKALAAFHQNPRGDASMLLQKRLERDPFGDRDGPSPT